MPTLTYFLFYLLGVSVCILIGLVALHQRWPGFVSAPTGKDSSPWPYYPKKLLSQPEQVLFHRMVQALPDHIVLAQVQVSRVLGVKKGSPFAVWNNKVNRLSYDFVVCRADASVLAVIELDDKTHASPSRIEADTRKERATSSAGLRLLRWNVRALPDVDTLRGAVLVETSTPADEQQRNAMHTSATDRAVTNDLVHPTTSGHS